MFKQVRNFMLEKSEQICICCMCLGRQISFSGCPCETGQRERFDHVNSWGSILFIYFFNQSWHFFLFVYNGKHMLAFPTLDERVERRSALMSRKVVSTEKHSQQNQGTSSLSRKLNPYSIPRGFFFLSSSNQPPSFFPAGLTSAVSHDHISLERHRICFITVYK